MIRRMIDILVAGGALVVLALPLACVALAVKLTSPGPAFFRQRRVGRYGQLFWFYKFRSMRVANAGPQVTAGDDRRITWLGKWLRRTKVDELPQLWNVLTGEMTLIGPRPEVERYVQHYNLEQREILAQKPGLAGMGQLMFAHEGELLRACSTPEEVETVYLEQIMPRKLAIDLEYERRRTAGSDLWLVFQIVLSILGVRTQVDRTFRIDASQTRTSTGAVASIPQSTEPVRS